jgi:HPt (histidine-containing phosphotransfer) domain-containing protein
VEKERLLSTVAHWLRRRGGAAGGGGPAALVDGGALRALAEQTNGQIMRDTVLIFFNDTASRLARIERAIASRDCQALSFEVHSIKSAAVTLGALRLGDLCRRVESACGQGSPEDALGLAGGLPGAFEETRSAFVAGGFLAEP